jgi:HK97 family phage portal protein
MIANAIGRCEFRTYRNHEEIREREYYLWNYEPNINQNSTAFLHKLIAQLYKNGEALIITSRPHEGRDNLCVADSYNEPDEYPAKQKEYRNVTVGNVTYDKTFRENEVLHIRLNHCNITNVLNAMYQSYYRLYDAAVRAYTWENGQHWKVHVDQIAQGNSDFEKQFAAMIQQQLKPFIESNGAILPEFDGYTYTRVKDTTGKNDTRDIRALVEDIFDFTARSFNIPAVLINGKIEGTAGAEGRFLTYCIDPTCDQLQEEIVRKRYGYDEWQKGNYLRIDSSSIMHFDLFENAANIEKIIGTGAFTINDVRRAAGQAEINEEWANQSFMTKNIASIDEIANPIKGGENTNETNVGNKTTGR